MPDINPVLAPGYRHVGNVPDTMNGDHYDGLEGISTEISQAALEKVQEIEKKGSSIISGKINTDANRIQAALLSQKDIRTKHPSGQPGVLTNFSDDELIAGVPSLRIDHAKVTLGNIDTALKDSKVFEVVKSILEKVKYEPTLIIFETIENGTPVLHPRVAFVDSSHNIAFKYPNEKFADAIRSHIGSRTVAPSHLIAKKELREAKGNYSRLQTKPLLGNANVGTGIGHILLEQTDHEVGLSQKKPETTPEHVRYAIINLDGAGEIHSFDNPEIGGPVRSLHTMSPGGGTIGIVPEDGGTQTATYTNNGEASDVSISGDPTEIYRRVLHQAS